MPDLDFQIEGAETASFAATPTIVFKLRITNGEARKSIHSIALRCQIQIEVTRRRTPQKTSRNCATCLASPSAGAKP